MKTPEQIADELESSLMAKFETAEALDAAYKIELIREIKKYPNHCWWVGENSFEHSTIEGTVTGIIKQLITVNYE